jgi:conserved oligomeric Golgi complex subunit 8
MLRREIRVMNDSASLRDVLDATIFFAVSLGRLGADFSALLPPLFEDKMLSLIINIWEDGIRQLSQTLKICREAGLSSPLSSTTVIIDATGEAEREGISDSGPMPPPRQLMALPPLGRFVNAILAGLNELRRCLLPGVFTRLRESLDQVLRDVNGVLESNERALTTPGLIGEFLELRGKAKEMRLVFNEIVVPYIRGAMELSLVNEASSMVFRRALVDSLKLLEAGPTQTDEAPLEARKQQATSDELPEESGEELTNTGDNVVNSAVVSTQS